MEKLKQRILERVSGRTAWGTELLRELLRFKSVSGNERHAQMYMAEVLEDLGCRIDTWDPQVQDLASYPGFLTVREDFRGSPNVVGLRKGAGGGKSLILNGHIDVVPAEDEAWKRSPWSGEADEKKVYGRGASDMKGGTVSFLLALKALDEAGFHLKGDIIVESVIEEESGGAGTLACVHRGYKADGALIPEPTDLRVYRASMGSMWFRITVKGKAAHGATAYLGVNAIHKLYRIIFALEDLERRRTSEKKHPLYAHVPIPFCINIGTLRSGNWPSSVPEEALIEGRMGVSPRETIEEARGELEDAVRTAARLDPWLRENPPQVEWFGSCWNSGEVTEDEPLVQTVIKHIHGYTGKKVRGEGAPWATDAGTLIRFADTPTVVFGPGTGAVAHQTDEYIDIEHIKSAASIMALTILDWCGYEK